MNCDPFKQRPDVGGLNALVAPGGTEPRAEFFRCGRSEDQAGGALGDLAGRGVRPRAPQRVGKRDEWLPANRSC